MSVATKRARPRVRGQADSAGRPVLLATLGVPLDPRASTFAVDSAVESARALIVVNVTVLQPLGLSMIMGYDALPEFTPEVSSSIEGSAELARSLGVHVERLRIRSPRPIDALVQLADERRPGVLVFGPERSAMSPRRYRRAMRSVLERVACLVWVPPDAAAAAS